MARLVTDPVDFLLDTVTHDLVIPPQFSRGIASVVQGIKIRLNSFKGDYFLNLLDGVPWLANDNLSEEDAILGGKFNQAKILGALRLEILAAPGVLRIITLTAGFDPATRRVRAAFAVKTEFGDTELETLVI